MYIYAFKQIWTLTILIIELHWSVNLPENMRSLVSEHIGLTGSFIIIFFPAFLGDVELDLQLLLLLVAVIQTVVGKENISTFWGMLVAEFWSWFYLLIALCAHFLSCFQVAQFVNYYLSGFMYLLIVIVVRVHLHDSVDTL